MVRTTLWRQSIIGGAAVIVGLVLFGWWHGSGALLATGAIGVMRSLGRLAGLLLVLAILAQLLMMSRAPWIERLWGLDRITRFHRWNGYAIVIFLIFHPWLLVASVASSRHISWWSQFTGYLRLSDDLVGATVAVGLFIAVIILSVVIVRRRLPYELWHGTHLLVYIATLLAFGHQVEMGFEFNQTWLLVFWYGLYLAVFAHVGWFRVLKPLWQSYRHQFRVERVVAETPTTTSLYITGRDLDRFQITPGQFMFFFFLTRGRWWQPHPFSLSAAPDGKTLRVTIKALGDFTNSVRDIPVGTRVILDGPYGVFTPNRCARDKVLCIAGGIGITPVRAVLEQFIALGRDTVLIYGNRTAGDVVFQSELEQLAARGPLTIHYVMSHDEHWPGEQGYVDEERLARLVADVHDREVYLCGPQPMMDGIRAILARYQIPTAHIHFEQFSL